ncbi:IS256 family transposase [Candidatus Bipolaricaulota bacterium]|nr:IS256 family transposase [Candidatus Bipolaricaulota bacterium]
MTDESIEREGKFNKPLNEMLKSMVKERLETLMETEREAFLSKEEPEDVANGYYNRDWETKFGEIKDLEVPRDREGEFSTKLFSPYQRRSGWLENLVIKMYSRGLSTRKIASLLEEMYGTHYSSTTVSRITDQTLEDVKEWRNRPLAKRYSVIFLDGMSFKLRRGSVANEVVYFAAGIDREGYREMLGFWFGAEESSTVWKEILEELKERGLEEVLLVATDDLPGIKEAVAQAFPKADHQQCVLHKVRNSAAKVRGTDEDELTDDLKKIYEAPDKVTCFNICVRKIPL